MNMPRPRRTKTFEEETCERVRRLETRMTQTMLFLGVPTSAQKPRFVLSDGGNTARMIAPSQHCSLKEILDNIPVSWEGPVGVFVGDDLIATVRKRGN